MYVTFFQDLSWISCRQVFNIKGVLMKREHPQRLFSAQIGGRIKIQHVKLICAQSAVAPSLILTEFPALIPAWVFEQHSLWSRGGLAPC